MLAFLCWAFVLPGSLKTEAAFSPAVPPRSAEAGKAVPLVLETPAEVAEVVLYYRVSGSRSFLRMPLRVRDGRVQAVLPSDSALPPGIEYYLELLLDDGRRITDPPFSPRYNPYHIEIGPPQRLTASLAAGGAELSPVDAVVLELDREVDPARVRMTLDGADVTGSVRIEGGVLRYEPPAPLAAGGHEVRLSLEDGPEIRLPFRVAGPPPADTASVRGVLRADGTLSFNYGLNVGNKTGSSGDRTSANLHVGFSAGKGKFSADFSGVNLQYVKDAPEEFTVSSGYLFRFAYDGQELDFGDLSITETPLTVSGYNRRGAQLRLRYGAVETHLFDVRAHTVEGFRSGISFTETDNQVYGLAVKFPVLDDDRLSVHLSGLTGKQDAEGFNTGSTAAPSEGDVLGLRLEGRLAGIRIDGEFAASWFDADTGDGEGKRRDSAFEINLSRDVVIGNLSLGLLRYGSDFASIANPNFTGDRRAVRGGFSSRILGAALSLNGSYCEDNVGDEPSRPVVGSASAGVQVSGSPFGGATLNLGYGLGRQESRREPAGAAGVDNLRQDFTFGLSFSGGAWNLSFNGGLGFLDDRLSSDRDTETRNFVLSGGVEMDRLSILPNLSWNETEGTAKTDRSRLASLSFSIPLWRNVLDLSGQGAYQLADASDDSVDTRTANGSIRIAWNVQALMRRVRLDWVNVQLAFSGSYNRVEDRKNPANTNEDYATFLALNLGAPYRFGAEAAW